jgi:hypothetical protein
MSLAALVPSKEASRPGTVGRPLLLVFLVYLALTSVVLSFWRMIDRFPVTGDEIHYLVMADGIARHGQLEQSVPYAEEFKERRICAFGLAPAEAVPSPENTHSIRGPHGLYNVHNIGLPLLLAVPYLLGGELGARLMMLLLSSLIVVLGWKVSSFFSSDPTARACALLTVVAGLPYIPASNQIFPDLLGGICALGVFYWLMTFKERPGVVRGIAYATVAAMLPWLQIKFAAASAVLLLGACIRMRASRWSLGRIVIVVSPFVLSLGLLALYNHYAFGKITGPYVSGALQLSPQSLMVLIGLHLDQNQGLLLQNPVLFVGVGSVLALIRYDRLVAWVWLLTYGALIVPNAMHSSWYGGMSFSGRFEWAAVVLFSVPTLMGLLRLHRARPRWFYGVVTTSLLVQAWFFIKYVALFADIYRRESAPWLDGYSIFYYPLHRWLPAMYNVDWAFRYPPNFAFLAIVLLVLIWSWRPFRPSLLLSGALLLLAVGRLLPAPADEPINWRAEWLPSHVGTMHDGVRVAESGRDVPGFMTYGPYVHLRAGKKYKASLFYRSSARSDQQVGLFDVVRPGENPLSFRTPIFGTSGEAGVVSGDFLVRGGEPRPHEFRTYWNGRSDLKVEKVVLERDPVDAIAAVTP